jgi:hypothetical protein
MPVKTTDRRRSCRALQENAISGMNKDADAFMALPIPGSVHETEVFRFAQSPQYAARLLRAEVVRTDSTPFATVIQKSRVFKVRPDDDGPATPHRNRFSYDRWPLALILFSKTLRSWRVNWAYKLLFTVPQISRAMAIRRPSAPQFAAKSRPHLPAAATPGSTFPLEIGSFEIPAFARRLCRRRPWQPCRATRKRCPCRFPPASRNRGMFTEIAGLSQGFEVPPPMGWMRSSTRIEYRLAYQGPRGPTLVNAAKHTVLCVFISRRFLGRSSRSARNHFHRPPEEDKNDLATFPYLLP